MISGSRTDFNFSNFFASPRIATASQGLEEAFSIERYYAEGLSINIGHQLEDLGISEASENLLKGLCEIGRIRPFSI